jgi:hypothetical protein
MRKLTNVHNQDGNERCKIGAALPPQESAAPTESPSPEHPDEVGADIIEDELWPTVGSKTASHILSADLLAAGFFSAVLAADLRLTEGVND